MDNRYEQEENTQKVVVNVIREELSVTKEVVEKDIVRVIKKVHETQETFETTEDSVDVQVEKVAINRFVESAPGVRYEGDTMIIPVLKEVMVTEKRLMLVEEVHVRQRKITTQQQHTVPLRSEEVVIERIPAHTDSSSSLDITQPGAINT